MKDSFGKYLFCFFNLIVVISNGLSVESSYRIRTRRETNQQKGKCHRPNQPANGNYISYIPLNTSSDPDTFPNNTVLSYNCNKNYALSSSNKIITCLEDGWSNDPPTCLKQCPPLHSTTFTDVKCFDKTKLETKCDEATDGAEAKFRCASFYESTELKTSPRYCKNGSWNLPPLQCKAVCGQKNSNPNSVKIGSYPWVVAIFKKINNEFINICGGTLLSEKIIVTAAHCLTESYGQALEPAIFKVGVGKYYNNYQDKRDVTAQYSDVQNIIIHPSYRGEAQRYTSDIGFLVTKDPFSLSIAVQPVCSRNVPDIRLTNQSTGILPGWGFPAETANLSDGLEEIVMIYKDKASCYSELSHKWLDEYYGYDKLCAGYYNNGTKECPRPSGKGLVFKNPQDGRFYIHGILSLGMKVENDPCETSTTNLYTKIATHYNFLEETISEYN